MFNHFRLRRSAPELKGGAIHRKSIRSFRFEKEIYVLQKSGLFVIFGPSTIHLWQIVHLTSRRIDEGVDEHEGKGHNVFCTQYFMYCGFTDSLNMKTRNRSHSKIWDGNASHYGLKLQKRTVKKQSKHWIYYTLEVKPQKSKLRKIRQHERTQEQMWKSWYSQHVLCNHADHIWFI